MNQRFLFLGSYSSWWWYIGVSIEKSFSLSSSTFSKSCLNILLSVIWFSKEIYLKKKRRAKCWTQFCTWWNGLCASILEHCHGLQSCAFGICFSVKVRLLDYSSKWNLITPWACTQASKFCSASDWSSWNTVSINQAFLKLVPQCTNPWICYAICRRL